MKESSEEEVLQKIADLMDKRARHDAGELIPGFQYGQSTMELLRLKRIIPRFRPRKAKPKETDDC